MSQVAGVRTPGHLENNAFGSVNFNVGPGACIWYACDYSYFEVIVRLCKRRVSMRRHTKGSVLTEHRIPSGAVRSVY